MEKDGGRERLKCIICGKKFSTVEMHEHISKAGSRFIDERHWRHYNKISKVSRDENVCFCGGRIKCHTFLRSEDDPGWELSCIRCDYLYNED